MATQNNPLKNLEGQQFDEWLGKLDQYGNTENIKDKFKVTSNIKFLGLGILCLVAVVILGGFAYMYTKIRSTVNNKRIL